MAKPPKTKREYTRHNIRLPGLCWEHPVKEKRGPGKEILTKDLSGGGIGFYSESILLLGTQFALELFLPGKGKSITCTIEVARIEATPQGKEYLIGTVFQDIKRTDLALVAKAIGKMDIHLLLDKALKEGASDIHFTIGHPPIIRKEGRIINLGTDCIEENQVEAMLFPLLSKAQIEFFNKNKELDFAFSPNPSSRFRVNIHSQKGFVEAALRSIPTRVISLKETGLPEDDVKKLCAKKSGLILIAGTTNSGKTTTMGAMIDHINTTMERVVITIEDPIEYVFKGERSILKQREIGSDTLSYAEALRRALRQDPDVICIGEILNAECLWAAMRATETGSLVITTVHASSATQALERIVNLFPPEQVAGACQQLSSCLAAIIYQLLLPSREGDRVAASELILNTPAVQNLIRERKFNLVRNVLQTGRGQGMYDFSVSVKELLEKNLIEPTTASEMLQEDVVVPDKKATHS
jgi:twitching motility protein PilT